MKIRNLGSDMNTERKNHNFINSFGNALSGIGIAMRGERNVRIELAFTAAVLLACVLLDVPFHEAVSVILCCVFVLGMEFVNSALERVVDLVSPEYHDLAKQAKDLGAGAVLIAATGSAIIGICVFIPKIVAVLLA